MDLLEEGDPDGGGLERPGADLSNLSLEVQVLPEQSDEFTCLRCYWSCTVRRKRTRAQSLP